MKNVVLIGFAATGKTTVGALLAETLHGNHVDTDEVVMKAEKTSVEEIFRKKGEKYFRAKEKEAVLSLPKENCVVSCGGGVPLDEENMRYLSRGTVVRLFADVDTLLARMETSDRPLHKGKDRAEMAAFLAEREKIYERYADFSVNVAGKTPRQVVEEICTRLSQ